MGERERERAEEEEEGEKVCSIWYGLNVCVYLKSARKDPSSNVTAFGDRVFAEVIKVK